LDKIEYHCIHFDRIIGSSNLFYITGQNEMNGIIYKGLIDIDNKKINNIKEIVVKDFPHGLDMYENLFSYTSYGDDCVVIEDINKF
jgi:hypothetical protein